MDEPAVTATVLNGDPAELLAPAAVAALYHKSESTLQKWRLRPDVGPPYIKLGKAVFYRRADVLAHIERCRRKSTLDGKRAAARAAS